MNVTSAVSWRSKDRWQIWAGLGGAVILHLAAVGLAETKSTPPPTAIVQSDSVIEVDIVTANEVPPPAPDIPLLTPPEPREPPLFLEEQSTPAPVHRAIDRKPIVRPSFNTAPKTASMAAAKVYAIYAPRPAYPYEARRQRITGSGVALLKVDPATGYVTDVSMAVSIGSPILDSATISAFRSWRFKPGTVSIVRTPITYELTGASY